MCRSSTTDPSEPPLPAVSGRGNLRAWMAEVAGDLWTAVDAPAWRRALNLVAGVMVDGAVEAERRLVAA